MTTPDIRPVRTNFPSPDRIEHPRDWEHSHWSFDEHLRTKGKREHVSAEEQAKRLLSRLMARA